MEILLRQSSTQVTDVSGSSVVLGDMSDVSEVTRQRLTYARQCQAQCLQVERSVIELQGEGQNNQLFPVTVGT